METTHFAHGSLCEFRLITVYVGFFSQTLFLIKNNMSFFFFTGGGDEKISEKTNKLGRVVTEI